MFLQWWPLPTIIVAAVIGIGVFLCELIWALKHGEAIDLGKALRLAIVVVPVWLGAFLITFCIYAPYRHAMDMKTRAVESASENEALKKQNKKLIDEKNSSPLPPVALAPEITIYFDNNQRANGGRLTVVVNKDGAFALPPILLHNDGNADAHEPRIRLLLSQHVEGGGFGWQRLKTAEKGFHSQFYYPSGPQLLMNRFSVAPGETWEVSQFHGQFIGAIPQSTSARINVFYGQRFPTSANFTIMTQPIPDTPSSSH